MAKEPQVNGSEQPPPATSGETKAQSHSVDVDAQEMVIESLRTQIQDLFSQVTELNGKLVKSYDRVSDLEDDIHVASANLRTSSIRISQLELERTQHLAALNTGLLVEKSHVTTELNRLMEKATEEAAQRGQAESAREAIEKDLDDLSAALFGQANAMVAEARLARHLSEQKVVEAESALKGAEEAVSIMQSQLQAMQADKEDAERKMHEMQAKMGKGKWLERIQTVDLTKPLKLMSSHVPYQEFLLFVAHLRSLHQTSPTSPAMPTILPLPFLSRLSNEDSDPTIRLDLAPSLNWLSRRSVLSAIHTGQLTIEPISVSSLLHESTMYSSPLTVAGLSSNNDSVSCALCGVGITVVEEHLQTRAQRLPSQGWSGSFFKKTRTSSISSRPPSPSQSTFTPIGVSPAGSQSTSKQVYIFRVAQPAPAPIASLPNLPIPSITKSLSQGSTSSNTPYLTPANSNSSHRSSPSLNNQSITIYPLCSSGWCLKRLRSTCTLWAYVRTGIVEKVWEEEIPFVPPPTNVASATPSTPSDAKPPLPPRKRGLWGLASAIGERAASWNDSDKDKKKVVEPVPSTSAPNNATPTDSNQPPLPPRPQRAPAMGRRVPPPPPPETISDPPPETTHSSSAPSSVPPPLPKRSEGRKHTPTKKPLQLEGHEEDAILASNPSTPIKLVFDAGDSHSPLRNAKPPLPTDVQGDSSSAAANITESQADSLTQTLAVTSSTSELPPTPTSPVRPKRFSVPRSIPLPDSRPGTPADANGTIVEGVSPPSRTASPAITGSPIGTAPPPLPRRAAARRPVPTIASAIITPSQSEVKVDPALESPANVVKEEAKTGDATSSPIGDGQNTDTAAQPLNGEGVEIDSKTAAPSTEGSVAREARSVVDTKDKTEAEVVDRSTPSSPASEVFVDALSAATTKETLAPAPSETDVGVNSPPSQLQAAAPEITGVVVSEEKVEDKTLTNGVAQPISAALPPLPTTEEPEHIDIGNDGSDKEVYIGEATWEERTWKELVRLREEMFWARLGGSR